MNNSQKLKHLPEVAERLLQIFRMRSIDRHLLKRGYTHADEVRVVIDAFLARIDKQLTR